MREKHKYNVFPEMSSEDYDRLRNDIEVNGYDESQPIWIYQEQILDGWNRYRACNELAVEPTIEQFTGNDIEAINFVMRTNKRRNLNSGQWACIAIEAEHIVEAIREAVEKERRQKQAETQATTKTSGAITELIPPQPINKRDNETRTKVANIFNTNERYVSEATKLKKESPETYEQVKAGNKTFSEVKKEQKQEKLKQAVIRRKEDESKQVDQRAVISQTDAVSFLNSIEGNSIDLLITDPPYSTDIDDIEAFAAEWLPLAIDKIKPTGRAYICIGAYPKEILAYLQLLSKQDKFIVDNPLIWTYKNTLGVTPKMKYNLNYQMIIHLYSKDSEPLDTSITNEMFSVQEINAPDGRVGNRFHRWQKPNELAKRLIIHSTKEGDTIIDPFAGSGTFLVAGASLGRKAVGCDIDEEAIKIAGGRGCITTGEKTWEIVSGHLTL